MTNFWQHKRGGWYVEVSLISGRRLQLWLGKVTKKQAKTISDNIEALRIAVKLNVEPDAKALLWALDSSLLPKLREAGLVRIGNKVQTIGEWFDIYLATRTDLAEGSKKGWGTAKKHATSLFGDRNLEEITVMECKQVVRDLQELYASSHAKKILERINVVFQAAVDSKQLIANPFAGLAISARVNKERQFYIDASTAKRVMAELPNQEAKVVFALARFAGFRVPKEPLELRWDAIDFTGGRMTTIDAKTKRPRTMPIFDGVRDELLRLRKQCPADQEYVVDKARKSSATAWRTWLLTAIREAGEKPWPKLWMNCRSSFRTDLERRHKPHVCNEWLGHSSKTAEKHYLQVTEEDYEIEKGR